MFKNLTYQRKLKLLLPLAIVSLLLVYFLGLSKTLQARSDIKQKQEKLTLSKDVSFKSNELKAKIKSIDEIVGNDLDSSVNVMDVLLENITNYCNSNNCIVKEIPEVHSATDKNFDIATYFITIEGNYKQLLNLVYELEHNKKSGGRISSCLFYTRKNNSTKKLSLELMLYIQQYNKK